MLNIIRGYHILWMIYARSNRFFCSSLVASVNGYTLIAPADYKRGPNVSVSIPDTLLHWP